MKRQVDKTGGKLWFNENLIDGFQDQLYKAIESQYKPFGSCIISGCEVTGSDIAEGIVYLDGKIMPFAAASSVTFPKYLKSRMTPVTAAYDDGHSDTTEEIYEAILSSTIPSSEYITISAQGGKTFRQAFQDANNRMVSDAKINEWNSLSNSKAEKNGSKTEEFSAKHLKAFDSNNPTQRISIINGLIYKYDTSTGKTLDLPLNDTGDIIAKADGTVQAKPAVANDGLVTLRQLKNANSSAEEDATNKASAARTDAVSDIRDSAPDAQNTLKKLHGWAVGLFNSKAEKNGSKTEEFSAKHLKAFDSNNPTQRISIINGLIYKYDTATSTPLDLPLNDTRSIIAKVNGDIEAKDVIIK